jgi:hypothetical protein
MNQSQFDSDLRTINMIYNKFGEIPTLEWIYNKTKKFVDGGTNPDYNQYAAVYKANKNNITAYTFNF